MNDLVKQSRLDKKPRETASIPAFEYHEVPGTKGDRLDVLEQLRANVAQIEDLHGRLGFLMGEIQSLVRKR